jgi:hypothetical protein
MKWIRVIFTYSLFEIGKIAASVIDWLPAAGELLAKHMPTQAEATVREIPG